MSTQHDLKELFRNASIETRYQASGQEYDEVFHDPFPESGCMPGLPDGMDGFVLYMALDPENVNDVLTVFNDRPDKNEIRDKIRYEATLFLCQTLQDFCLDARRDGTHELSDVAFDNASVLVDLANKDQPRALQVANDLIRDLPDATAGTWEEYYHDMLWEQGLMQFKVFVGRDDNDKPVLCSALNFECPYYRSDTSVRAAVGQNNARPGLEMWLCATPLDAGNLPESCYKTLIKEFPAIADMTAPDFLTNEKPHAAQTAAM